MSEAALRGVRILGIDPGSQVTGFGLVDQLDPAGSGIRHVAHGTLRPRRSVSLAGRLDDLHRAVLALVEQHRPDVASVEQVFVASSPRAALVLGQARGAVLAALGASGLGLHEYAPTQIKQALTGSGAAAKRQVQLMVRRLLALERAPALDASDALAAAICHAQAGRLGALGVTSRTRSRRRAQTVLRVRRAP